VLHGSRDPPEPTTQLLTRPTEREDGCVALVSIENVNGVRSVSGSARTMAQLHHAIIKQMMSTATDAELIALGERFEKLLLEYVDLKR
jgi:hypothetical protein